MNRVGAQPVDSAATPPTQPEQGGTGPAVQYALGEGLALTSADERFRLTIGGSAQGRWTVERETGSPADQEVTLRRARVHFSGHLFSPDVRFKVQLGFAPADLGMGTSFVGAQSPQFSPILDAFLELRPLRDLEVRVGQFKVASNRERGISSSELQLVDRSILNSELTLDRDVGLELSSRDLFGTGRLAYRLGVFSGHGREARGIDGPSLMYVARFDVTAFGRFGEGGESDIERGAPRLAVGGGYAYVDHGLRDRGPVGNRPEDGGTTSSHHVFADVVFKWEGLSVLGELAWREGERTPGSAVDAFGAPMPVTAPRNGWGANVQLGYVLPWVPFELAGRYSTVRGEGATSLDPGNELTFGVSCYILEHAYKIQADYSRMWSDRPSTGDDRVRLQAQVSF